MLVPEIEIIVSAGGAELLRKTVRPGDYVIGREAECEVVVEVELVSRRHAQLTVNYDHALIEDLGSSNGTFVNGKPVTEPTRLWPNQKIQIGAATIELRRVKTVPPPDVSLAPSAAAVRRLLPEELLRGKKYDIGGVVAQGGMGAILDAHEAATERNVAMKVMLDGSSPDDLTRFVAEAKVTAQLEHPNIVPVHELSVDENGQVFYTMKFVRGITLKKVLELMAGGNEATLAKYPLGALLTIFQKVCDAVAFAHSKSVIHRDLKPENIMLGDFGEVLLMDWGLAKVLGKDEGGRMKDEVDGGTGGEESAARSAHPSSSFIPHPSSFTMSGTILGTPQYMAPEQARGEVDDLDQRADIYALGAILYHVLALRPSVQGDDAMAIVEKVARGEIDPLGDASSASVTLKTEPKKKTTGARAISDSLTAVVRKALAHDRERRYPRVEDLQADILAYQNGFATSAEQAGAGKQFALFVRRNKAASIGVAAVLLVGGVLGTRAILEGQRAQRGEALARSEATRAEREAAAAKATLADLRRTAPVFAAQAKVDFEEGNFDDAIEKIGYAIELDDSAADYHLFRANLRESLQDLAAAEEGYRRVLALRPADAEAKTNLALCEKLLRESGGPALPRAQQLQLLAALREQKRLVEAAPLAALIDPDVAVARAAILSRLREARKQSRWNDNRVSALPDGTFKVSLKGLAPIDFSVLQGQPVSALNLESTGIADLSSLAGLPLKELSLRDDRVTDLSPLRGMPLENLNLQRTKADLSPLRGMKLHTLKITSTAVSDLSPFAGMPLTDLDCTMCKKLSDVSPLRGAPLKSLTLSYSGVKDLTPLSECASLEELSINSTPVADLTALAKLHLTFLRCGSAQRITSIAPLRGQPLRKLDLQNTSVTDLSPLAGCTTLEEITLPAGARDLTALRGLPRLKLIAAHQASTDTYAFQSAAEFWKEYDAQQAAGKK